MYAFVAFPAPMLASRCLDVALVLSMATPSHIETGYQGKSMVGVEIPSCTACGLSLARHLQDMTASVVVTIVAIEMLTLSWPLKGLTELLISLHLLLFYYGLSMAWRLSDIRDLVVIPWSPLDNFPGPLGI